MKKVNIDTGAVKKSLQTVGTMVMGAALLTILAASIWATVNADVLFKAIRYPEAVREMQVEVLIKK